MLRVNKFGQNQPTFGPQGKVLQEGIHLRSSSHRNSDALHSMPNSSVMPDSSDKTTFATSSTIIAVSTVTVSTAYTNIPDGHVSTTVATPTTTTDTTNPVLYGNVPLGEPVSAAVNAASVSESSTTTTSTVRKHGKLDLRRKTKQATANLNIQVSQHDKQDLNSIKKYLDKKKVARAQVEDMNAKPKSSSSTYQYLCNFYPSLKPVATIDNPLNKRQIATPRPNRDYSIPPGLQFEYWMCACCDMVNTAKYTDCKKCKMPQESLSVSKAFCTFCNLLAYVPEERMSSHMVCPLCRDHPIT